MQYSLKVMGFVGTLMLALPVHAETMQVTVSCMDTVQVDSA